MKTKMLWVVAGLLLVAGAARTDDRAAPKQTAEPLPMPEMVKSSGCADMAAPHRYYPRGWDWINAHWLPEKAKCGEGWEPCKGGKLLNWLCYKPQKTGCCGKDCTPCCTPPLYAFFLPNCQGGCGASASVPPPARP